MTLVYRELNRKDFPCIHVRLCTYTHMHTDKTIIFSLILNYDHCFQWSVDWDLHDAVNAELYPIFLIFLML